MAEVDEGNFVVFERRAEELMLHYKRPDLLTSGLAEALHGCRTDSASSVETCATQSQHG